VSTATLYQDPLRRGLCPEEAAPYYAPALGIVMESGSVATVATVPSHTITHSTLHHTTPPDYTSSTDLVLLPTLSHLDYTLFQMPFSRQPGVQYSHTRNSLALVVGVLVT